MFATASMLLNLMLCMVSVECSATTDYCFSSLVPVMFLYSSGDVLADLMHTLLQLKGITRVSRGHKWISKKHSLYCFYPGKIYGTPPATHEGPHHPKTHSTK
jgi:hypothetical protein